MAETKKASVRKNYIYNTIYQVVLLIAPLITAPYVSRVLEPDGVGAVSYAESIVSYFTLFATMGIKTYGQREISYVQDAPRERSVAFWNIKILEACTSSAVLLIYVVFALSREQSALYLMLSLNIVAVLVDVTWFFQGMEEFGKIVVRNTALKLLNIAYIFLFVRQKDDLSLYALGLGLFTVLGNLSLWLYLPKYISRIPVYELHPFRNMRAVWSLFVPTIAIQVYTVLDKTMIGIITKDDFQNGYYEQAIKISKMLLALVTSLGTVMVPRIGFHFARGDQEKVRELMYRGYRFVWLLGIPLCLGLAVTAGNFVPWFFGSGYGAVVPVLSVLAFLILAIGINNVTGIQYLIPTKRQNIFTRTVLIGAAVNFSLNSVLIYRFGALGAAVASVVAETTIAIAQLIIVRRELSPWRVLKEGAHYYIAGFVMLLALLPLGRHLSPSVPHTAIMAVIGAAVYFLILLLEHDEFLLSNLKKMARR